MIITKTVEIKTTIKNYEHFKALGYEIEFYKDRDNVERLKQKVLIVKVEELPKSSHAIILVECDVCGKMHERTYKEANRSKNHCCSIECTGKLHIKRKEVALEERLRQPLELFLKQKYLAEFLSIREISKLIYGDVNNASTVNGWLKKFNIPLRQGSEAIKTQWINADERREKSKENFKDPSIREKANKSLKKESVRLKISLSKKGEKNPMFGITRENHPNWNKNLTDEERQKLRKSIEYTRFRRKVFKRDKHTCQKCGDNQGGNLNAHHIRNHSTHKELRYDVNNGITLCKKCHIEFHKKYGYKNNNENQIKEFLFVIGK